MKHKRTYRGKHCHCPLCKRERENDRAHDAMKVAKQVAEDVREVFERISKKVK